MISAHGAPLRIATEQLGKALSSDDTCSGYRNLFGEVPPDERYKGFGFDEPSRLRNRRMFRWLAARFGRPYEWPGGDKDNRRISAGYTYFAQFVIHDSVQSLTDLPDLTSGPLRLRNSRTNRLMLDTIYGDGPTADPLFYTGCPAHPQAQGFLRISGRPDAHPLRDLPRSPCPFAGKPAYSDVLIADSRNDDNALISQLTVIFHLFHNIVYDTLSQTDYTVSDTQIFALTRKVVTRVYRQIVIEDLLKKLLHPSVYQKYMDEDETAHANQGDPRMLLEFSHAAARVGHFMVRDQYPVNPALNAEEQGIDTVLRQTSALLPRVMPLAPKWLINWATLFDKNDGYALRARRFGPAVAPALVDTDLFREPGDPAWEPGDIGGLVYRDFVRGGESDLRSVSSIVAKLPQWVAKLSPLLRGGVIDTTTLSAWLSPSPSEETSLGEEDFIDCLKSDIPLLLFILLEAAATSRKQNVPPKNVIRYGECLGAVGSYILAEFFFREYWRTRPLIEDDETAKAASDRIFDGSPPADMPSLIAEISRRKDWSDVTPTFW